MENGEHLDPYNVTRHNRTTQRHSCVVGFGEFFFVILVVSLIVSLICNMLVSKQLLASGTWATHWNCGISRSQGRNWQERSAASGCQDISGLENRWSTSSFDRDLKVDVAASVTMLKLQQVVFLKQMCLVATKLKKEQLWVEVQTCWIMWSSGVCGEPGRWAGYDNQFQLSSKFGGKAAHAPQNPLVSYTVKHG